MYRHEIETLKYKTDISIKKDKPCKVIDAKTGFNMFLYFEIYAVLKNYTLHWMTVIDITKLAWMVYTILTSGVRQILYLAVQRALLSHCNSVNGIYYMEYINVFNFYPYNEK